MKEKGVAEALLRERLPASLVGRFAGSPELLSESFVDDALKGSVADLVLRVRLKGGRTACVYCLLEHKRTQEALLLVQVLRYVTAIYAQLARAGRGPPLPMVVPLIIYNGDAKWTGPRRFSELVDTSPQLKGLTVDFGVVLVDVGAESARRLSSHKTLKGGLLGLKAAATPPERLEAVITQMVGALADDPSTLKLFLRYLVGVAGREARPFVERAAERQTQGKERVMQTIADFYVSRGYRRGKREGLKAGLKEGREEALKELRKSVRRVLTHRFKRVPSSVAQKLAEADAVRLGQWLEASVQAKSLKAVFAQPD